MGSKRIPQHRGRYLFEEMDGEGLVYRAAAKQGIYLSETATVVWKLCDGTRTVDEIIDFFVATYPDAADAVRTDVSETIDELIRAGALKFTEPQTPPAPPPGGESASTDPA
jgi:Coenzyme PQQ synthesis protein D (PqqD)